MPLFWWILLLFSIRKFQFKILFRILGKDPLTSSPKNLKIGEPVSLGWILVFSANTISDNCNWFMFAGLFSKCFRLPTERSTPDCDNGLYALICSTHHSTLFHKVIPEGWATVCNVKQGKSLHPILSASARLVQCSYCVSCKFAWTLTFDRKRPRNYQFLFLHNQFDTHSPLFLPSRCLVGLNGISADANIS